MLPNNRFINYRGNGQCKEILSQEKVEKECFLPNFYFDGNLIKDETVGNIGLIYLLISLLQC